MVSRIFTKIFGGESEFAKRWMARTTVGILVTLLFIIPLIFMLLLLHIKIGLSYRMSKMVLESYCDLCKICVSAYFVAFVGYMGKAFLAKKEEEANKLKKEIHILKGSVEK